MSTQYIIVVLAALSASLVCLLLGMYLRMNMYKLAFESVVRQVLRTHDVITTLREETE
jgi:hypothetical protein